MRKISLNIFYLGFIFINSINACPVEDEDRMLSELCAMYYGDWSINRLN